MSNSYQQLDASPSLSSILHTLESFDAYYPLTPGQSPENVALETDGDESASFYSLSQQATEACNNDSDIHRLSIGHNKGTFDVTPESSQCDGSGESIDLLTNSSLVRTADSITSQNAGQEDRKVKKRRRRTRDDPFETVKATSRALQYPPCCVCGGKASGDHYGVNSCEACKGFFRRYLLREKGAFQCKKSGCCEVTHTIKGMCSGCRLKKCLELGMAKEKCKLGRYSSEKRTEKIKSSLEMNGLRPGPAVALISAGKEDKFEIQASPCKDSVQEDEIFARTLSQLDISDDHEKTFGDKLVADLIRGKNDIKTFHMERCLTDDEIQAKIKEYHDHYTLKVKMYGEMKPVPKEEFTKLYGEFGIDIDDRMKELKFASENIEEDVNYYCSFAKRIPYFSKLSFKDQSNLLKAGRMDFYTTLLSQGYNHELQVFLYRYRPYHVNEMAIFFSKELIHDTLTQYLKCQKLGLNSSEKSLVLALCLFFTDRCKLENPVLVEKIQLSLTQLLRRELEKTCPGTAISRFAKIIDYLTSLREVSDQYFKEFEDLCRDELYLNECPLMTDFLLET